MANPHRSGMNDAGWSVVQAAARAAERIADANEPAVFALGADGGLRAVPAGDSKFRRGLSARRDIVERYARWGAEGRDPSAGEISEARRCVGYEKIEASAPDRIRLRSDCVEIDLGGIGKGYAVDRAIGVLKAAGIRHALINAGSSSIASIGSPPDRQGWPVLLNARVAGHQILLLRDRSISTSEQSSSGEIIDPRTGAPAESKLAVSVVAPSATVSDALSTTLLMLPLEDAMKLLPQFDNVSALWMTRTGELKAVYGESRLQLSGSR